jgi:hypothetical protein
MANVALPSVAIVTPAAADTIVGIQGGAVRRFSTSQFVFSADSLISSGTIDATTRNVTQAKTINSIAGGDANTISGGGNSANPNTITGSSSYRTIAGGYDNTIGANIASTISGGAHHVVSGTATHATVGGGSFNDVTGGDYGTIGGGTGHTVTASEATIAGGTTNTASGQGAAVGGGSNNTASGARGTVAGGINNTAGGSNTAVVGGTGVNVTGAATVAGGNTVTGAGTNGFAFGFTNAIGADYAGVWGRENTIGAAYTTAKGYKASTRCPGGDYLAGGQISASGDAQSFVAQLKVQTTAGTATHMTLPDSTNFLTGPTAGAQYFEAMVTAYEAATGDTKAIKLTGTYKRIAGSTSFIGSLTTTVISADAGAAAWSATVSSSAGTAGFRVTVTGEAAKTINWSARVVANEAAA